MYYFIIAAIVAVDQWTKHLVQTNMNLNDTIPLVDGIFHFTYIHNYGAAFSVLEGHQGILLAITGTVIAAMLGYLIWGAKKLPKVIQLCLALIVGGGIGNLLDRMVRGYVVDFFDFRVWPIFNVADIAVVCGCLLLIYYVIVLEPKEEKRNAEMQREDTDNAGK